ncbi:effector-associated domain 2-containing protein [Stenotrophomonas sp. NPDC087984]|uniref:VMAP-C domain-containing protein n=1 Tax=unclassified Streptomyces TaxID=2593676 RepID=UPI00369661B6
MAAMGEGGLKSVGNLVTALKEFRCLTDPDLRTLCLDLVAMELEMTSVPVRVHRVTDYFLVELARECLENVRIMHALRASLAVMAAADEDAMMRLDSVMEQMTARPALPETAAAKLRSLLEELEIEQLGQLCRTAAGPLQDIPAVTGPWHAFEVLSRMNAQPGGLPPGLALVEYLAAAARPLERADALREWADERARELGLTPQLRSLRQQVGHAAPAGPVDAYLVIRLLPQEEAGCYELSSWHQYDPSGWHPARGPVTQVTSETAERAVQTLVYEAAEEWDDAGAIHVEFMLDSDDLNLPVHRWRLELDSESPIPLYMGGYPVVVRSLERSRTRRWHREWKQRWNVFDQQPERAKQLVVDGEDPDSPRSGDTTALLARLKADPQVVALILNSPPGATPEGNSEVLTAWRAGIPVVAWDGRMPRDPCFVQQLRQKQAEPTGNLARLREAVTELRLDAHTIGSAEGEHHLGQHVVLVWDDPTRPVEPLGRMTGPDDGVGGR